ncbi:hypothetical protein EMIHUDRAFT_460356 [Emiliania huxleyi CCMP1516]|uniref:Mono(ADP-ribosyl)transferase n=2 Tax=Emiliania huxleyi TaxID=2903 RepID=A0A0D3KX14_EMIH1|nr:hypothetical protein EMIHUDRAFT_460356 [Emiliania huxleyi CCMP1516]EOD40299.1 hypothetical protein EMIHUDRAFT_460356 [Emiliania huxleyi CCMP1516]|eukprot:XP_005792728.1 hypothetical protein EMIHUDRAFT_460356 [Emiliania huxleyi CCMP1516]
MSASVELGEASEAPTGLNRFQKVVRMQQALHRASSEAGMSSQAPPSTLLKRAGAPSMLINLALVEERHGKGSWQYRLLALQKTRRYTAAFIALLLCDATAAILGLLLSTAYPPCVNIKALASCPANSSTVTVIDDGVITSTTTTSDVEPEPSCSESGYGAFAAAMLAVTVISMLSIVTFLAESLLVSAALGPLLLRTSRSFRLWTVLDLLILTFALGVESYLLLVKHPTASERAVHTSSPALVLLSRGYRYVQLARRSYTILRRVHHTRKSGRDLIEGGEAQRARSELDGALEERRNELLIARQESGEGRVHPSKLVLQVCADMLLSVSREVGSREWDEVRELAAAAGIRALDGFVERLLKRRLLPLYSRPEGFYENDSNLANTLFQAVKYKESMGAWPEGLAALIKDANTPDSLRGVILDDLGPGGYGPLALVVRASRCLRTLDVDCSDSNLWRSSGKEAFIESLAESSTLRQIDLSTSHVPPDLLHKLCARLACGGEGVGSEWEAEWESASHREGEGSRPQARSALPPTALDGQTGGGRERAGAAVALPPRVAQIEAVSLAGNAVPGCGASLALLLEQCGALTSLDLSRTCLTEADGALGARLPEGWPAARHAPPAGASAEASNAAKPLQCVVLDVAAVPPEERGRLPAAVAAMIGDELLDRGEIRKVMREASDLVTGTLLEAAHGLQHYMRVSEEHIRQGVAMGTAAIEEEVRALGDAEALSMLQYILHDPASEKEYPNGTRDAGRSGERLADFVAHADAQKAMLDEPHPHVVALRLYTTAAYRHINGPLRKPEGPHPLARTTWFISEAVRKLRAVHADSTTATETEDLWRGMRNMQLSSDFIDNRTGGTELAPMSATTDMTVAARYGASSGTLLFKIRVDNSLVRGASLQWVSAFPREAEVLFPPLTYVQPTDKRQTLLVGACNFTVIEVVPNLSS